MKAKREPAASYVRMSSAKQDRSPAQQRAEIAKLAAAQGYEVAIWQTDEAVTGDSGPDERPGFRRLLEAAKAGRFKVLLAWNLDRIGRFDSIDAGRWLSQLRDAGVVIHTCVDGRIDLNTPEGRMKSFMGFEPAKAFLQHLAENVVRAMAKNALAGWSCGAKAPYGFDRAEFAPDGRLVRRLAKNDRPAKGHHVGLVPAEDRQRIEAVRFAFNRYATARLSARGLARELAAKGYPSASGKGWTARMIEKMLANPVYAGARRWGARSRAKYCTQAGGDIMPAKSNGKREHQRAAKDAMVTHGAHKGLVPVELFEKVQRRLAQRSRQRRADNHKLPLIGLVYCQHCGKPCHGHVVTRRQGGKTYHYAWYVCPTYSRFGKDPLQNTTCGRFAVDANRLHRWIVPRLQEVFLGPGRDALVEELRRQLKAAAKPGDGETERLRKRLAALDKEVGRLVKAIRTTDAPELLAELEQAREERQAAQDALQRAGEPRVVEDIDAEAERLADAMIEFGERLDSADPATVREAMRLAVSRVECRFEQGPPGPQGQRRCRLIEGRVFLRKSGPFPFFSQGTMVCGTRSAVARWPGGCRGLARAGGPT